MTLRREISSNSPIMPVWVPAVANLVLKTPAHPEAESVSRAGASLNRSWLGCTQRRIRFEPVALVATTVKSNGSPGNCLRAPLWMEPAKRGLAPFFDSGRSYCMETP